MKKSVLFLLISGSFSMLSAQNQLLSEYFKNENLENQKKFNQYFKKSGIQNRLGKKYEEKRVNLAGFLNQTPLFWKSDDRRANNSANVTELQSGTVNGNAIGINIDGTGLNIIVMDGGRVFEKHREFGADATGNVLTQRIFDKEFGTTTYSNHATNVAGIIGAIGFGNFSAPYGANAAKGVLTNANFDSYSFSTTPQGTNYQKLGNAFDANISNHSYGINLGWEYESATTGDNGEGWYYPFDNYSTNPDDTFSGSYYTQDANFDKIVYANPNQIIIKSAGNSFGDGPLGSGLTKYKWDSSTDKYIPFTAGESIPSNNCANGYYCIGWGSLAKNIIVVGATDQLTTVDNKYTISNDVVKSDYSSAGPRKDGAIKPDISAVGTTMLVAGHTNDTTYNTYYAGSGTSYSAPVVSGIAGAVTQLNRHLTGNAAFTYKADEMKTLLIHTASEAGTNLGPDVWYGWGFADAARASQLAIDKKNNLVIFERNALTSGVKYTKEVTAKSNEPLKATISWIDPAATTFTTVNDLFNNHTSRLVNDLDLRIIDTTDNTIYYPWKLDVNNPLAAATKADNTVDNVEQVLINAPIAGRKYRIEVSNKGNLVNDNGSASTQNYALIATGIDTSTTTEIAYNNFNIETKSETCSGKNNGEINITANQTFNYTAKINNGNLQNFTNNKLNITNLAPGNYNVCIYVASINYEQCFNITVSKGVTASARMATSNSSNIVTVNVEQGTAPYKIYINGVQELETNENNFTINAKKGDIIELKTAVACEGTVSKNITVIGDKVIAYPNPVKDFVHFTIPTSEKEIEIELYSADGKLINKKLYLVTNGEAKVDLSNLDDGIYFAKISLKNPENIKIIKKH